MPHRALYAISHRRRALWVTAALTGLALAATGPAIASVANPNLKSVTLWDGQSAKVLCPNGIIFDNAVVGSSQQVNCFRATTTTVPTTTVPTSTTTTRPATTTTSSTSTTTTVPVSGSTVASLFGASLFNQSAAAYPVDPNSSAYVGEFTSQDTPALSANDPIYVVGPGAQMANVTCGGCSGQGQVPVPSGYDPSSGSDKPIFIVDPSLNKLWEFWLFAPSGSGYAATWGGGATLSTFSGVFPNPYGESATGISYAATAITNSDVSQGAIDHAMAVAIGECSGQAYPATRNDCGGGGPPEGQMFRFSASVNCSAFSGLAKLVCVGGQRYGFVITDKTGGPWVVLSAQEGVSGSLNGLPWSSLQAIDPPQG